MLYTIATMADEKISAIQSLEKDIGAPLLAMTQVNVIPAKLNREKLSKIHELEEELGVVLVAVDTQKI